jgi:hypothetical protein
MRAVVSAVAVVAVLLAPSTQTEPADGLSVTPATVRPGDRLTVSGTGCPTGSTVSVLPGAGASDAPELASIPARDDGSFNGTVGLPAGTEAGSHTITAVCAGQPVGSARFQVVERPLALTGGAPALLTLSKSAVTPGGSVRVFGRPCTGGRTTALLDSRPVPLAGSTRVGDAVRAEVAVPRGTPPGAHTLSTRCKGVTTAAATLRVVVTGGRLPRGAVTPYPRPPGANRMYLLVGVIAALALVLTVSVTLGLQRYRTRISTPGYFDLPSQQQRPTR